MGYLTFRGVSTQNLSNVYVQMMPSHKKAAKRTTDYYVKGRDGVLHTDDGFDNTKIPVRLVMINAPAQTRQIINAWADGTGKLISSDDLSRCWMATVIDEIIYDRVEAATIAPSDFSITKPYYINDFVTYQGMIYKFKVNHAAGAWNSEEVAAQPWKIDGLYDTAEITFDCQPYMYESIESVYEITSSGTIVNAGTAESYPLIKVEAIAAGDVEFTVNGSTIKVTSMAVGTPVFIDCENGYIYSSDGNAKEIIGDIPVFGYGNNTVAVGTNCSKVTVTPHWRWV